MNFRAPRVQPVVCAAVLVAATRLLAADPADVKKLKETRQCAGCNLQNADLPGQNLTGANLTRADLSGANLYAVTLVNANLAGATLAEANLRGANLRGARGAALAGAITNERTTCPGGQRGPCE